MGSLRGSCVVGSPPSSSPSGWVPPSSLRAWCSGGELARQVGDRRKASPVKVVLEPGGATRNLDKATSRNDPNTVSFVAVAGAWETPVLAVSGPRVHDGVSLATQPQSRGDNTTRLDRLRCGRTADGRRRCAGAGARSEAPGGAALVCAWLTVAPADALKAMPAPRRRDWRPCIIRCGVGAGSERPSPWPRVR